ncbi:MAG: nucleotidyltransferase family protein [Pseudomonadota bacterium]
MITCAVLLASGRSTRFGSDDKLTANLLGKPLVLHAAEALQGIDANHQFVVTQSEAVARLLPLYEHVAPTGAEPQQSDSLKAGIDAVLRLGADRVVVTLGDMPFVTTNLIQAICDRAHQDCAAAAYDGGHVLPPACFPQSQFADLMALTGDRGAGALLRKLPQTALVTAEAMELVDIDTKEDLEAAEAQRGRR